MIERRRAQRSSRRRSDRDEGRTARGAHNRLIGCRQWRHGPRRHEALGRRHPKSGRRGRLGAPADVVLRLLVLKHVRNWSEEFFETAQCAQLSTASSIASMAARCLRRRSAVGDWRLGRRPASGRTSGACNGAGGRDRGRPADAGHHVVATNVPSDRSIRLGAA